MAGFTTATAISTGLSVLGTGSSIAGKIKGGQQSAEAAAFRARVGQMNAQIYEQNAVRAVQGGEVASDIAGMRTQQKVGATKVAQAANNIDVNKGSAVDVRAGVAEAGRFDQLTTLSNAQLQGYGYRVKAAQARAQAGLDEGEAGSAGTAGYIGAAGTLLSGASSLPFGWLTGDSSAPNGPPGSGGKAGA